MYILLLFMFSSNSLYAGDVLSIEQAEEYELLPFLERLPLHSVEEGAGVEAIAERTDFTRVRNGAMPAFNQEVWYRFRLKNNSGKTDRWVVDFAEILFDDIEFYYRQNGKWSSYRDGLLHNLSVRPIESFFVAFPLEIQPGETSEFYFRITTMHQPLVFPVLYSEKRYISAIMLHTALSLTIIGILLGITLVTAGTIIASKDNKRLLLFSLVIVCVLLLIAYTNGFIREVIIDNPPFHRALYPYLTAVTNIAFLLFVRELFEFKKRRPRYDRLLIIYMSASVIYPILHMVLGVWPLAILVNIISMLSMLILFAIGVDGLRQSISSSFFYLLSLLLFLAPTVYTLLGVQGFTQYDVWSRHVFEFGALFLGVFTSLSIRDRLRESVKIKDESLSKTLVVETREQMKSEFLAAMSHEIRTPINGVLGMAQMLQHTEQTQTQAYYTDIIINSGQTLLTVINDILDLSKADAGKLTLDEDAVDLGRVMVFASNAFGAVLKNRKINFSYKIDPVAPLYVIGDPIRLEQVISNLLANAAKFTNQGSIDFLIEKKSELEDDKVMVRFSIADTGIGIPESMQEAIFDPYTQDRGSSIKTSPFHSTGLGLSICKRLVELMKGTISLSSEVGKGSTFWFDIPMQIDLPKQHAFNERKAGLKGYTLGIINMPKSHAAAISLHFNSWGLNVIHFDTEQGADEDWQSLQGLMYFHTGDEQKLGRLLERARVYHFKVLALLSPKTEEPEINDSDDLLIYFLRVPAGVGFFLNALAQMLLDTPYEESLPENRTQTAVVETGEKAINVLVVEDNIVNQKVVKAMLGKLSCKVYMAENGRVGLDAFKANAGQLDLIIMDCEMPVLDGYACTEAIREFEQEQQLTPVTIIALTAHALPVNHDHCMSAGMDSVLTKPLDYKLLDQAVRRVKSQISGSV